MSAWLYRANLGVLPKIRSFAARIQRERVAVEAALSSVWSNSRTEGQVNRFKAHRRQMYSRAKLVLLGQRSHHAA